MPNLLTIESLEADRAYVARQLADTAESPWGTARIMWESRLREIDRELEAANSQRSNFASVALIFDGAPVVGSSDIQVDFATEALDSYQKIVALAVAAQISPELGIRGPMPGADRSKLFIRDIIRGSMGFVLEEIASEQAEMVPTALKNAVEQSTQLLSDLSSSTEETFNAVVAETQPRMINAIQRFTKSLHDSGANAKILGDKNRLALTSDQIRQLSARLNDVEISENTIDYVGTLLGVLPNSLEFELRLHDRDETVIKGGVSHELASRYVADAEFQARFLLQTVRASVKVISTMRHGQTVRERYVLDALSSAVLLGRTPSPLA